MSLTGKDNCWVFADRKGLQMSAFADLIVGSTSSPMSLKDPLCARCHGLIVATLNIKHFTALPGVRVEDWTEI